MKDGISKQARSEVLEALRARYEKAKKSEKTKILDEFVAVAHCHRKHAVRLLSRPAVAAKTTCKAISRRIYNDAVKEALLVLWEASDRICGKRLKAVLPGLLEAMERHGHLELDPKVRDQLSKISASTIDRLLKPARRQTTRRKKRSAVKKLSSQIPIRTFADWKEPLPGFLEIDFVLHSGGNLEGSYLHSLVATDVCSGWTEAVALLAREQSLVTAGLQAISQQLPVAMCGIDSDNDSAFINETVLNYCKTHQLEFTRSRAYQKNDQAWIEQKNGAVIRRFIGYARYTGPVAGQALAHLYAALRLYNNFFQPSFKLIEKTRDGAKTRKRYDKPMTPCERLLSNPAVNAEVKTALQAQRLSLDPIKLLHRIREAQAGLAALGTPELTLESGNQSLEQFLSQLPTLWKQGEVRPTHAHTSRKPRHWRTRPDPFEGVWSEILLWLQKDPDATAKALFARLQENYPDRFTDGQLRTLQRRVAEWREIMAKQLVYGTDSEQLAEAHALSSA